PRWSRRRLTLHCCQPATTWTRASDAHENVHRRGVILEHDLRDTKSRLANPRRDQTMPSTIIREPVTARIRGNAVAAVEAYAAQDGVTRSEFIAKAVYRELSRA